jgi:beta-galactosidase
MAADPDGHGKDRGWMLHPPPNAAPASVPSAPSAARGAPRIVWYFRSFGVPATWKGQTVRLVLGAVAQSSTVWLNGQLLGSSTEGAAPQSYYATKQIVPYNGGASPDAPQANNLLAVRATGDALSGPGIWQDVTLVAHDEAYIADCAVQAGIRGHVTAAITLQNTSDKSGDATLDAKVLSLPDRKPVVQTFQILALAPGRNITTLLVTVPSGRLQVWSPAHPTLYMLQLSFRQGTDVLDTLDTVFGCRDLDRGPGGGIVVDGSPVAGSTVAMHDFDAPTPVATAAEASVARTQLRVNQNNGVGVVYLEAPAPGMLDLADELGMVVCEGPRHGLSPEAARSELLALVARDRSHPSVAAWNLAPLGQGAELASAIDAIRSLDPTRIRLTP